MKERIETQIKMEIFSFGRSKRVFRLIHFAFSNRLIINKIA